MISPDVQSTVFICPATRIVHRHARSYPSPTAAVWQFGNVPLSVGVEKVSSQAIISTMVAPSHRNEV